MTVMKEDKHLDNCQAPGYHRSMTLTRRFATFSVALVALIALVFGTCAVAVAMVHYNGPTMAVGLSSVLFAAVLVKFGHTL